MITEKQIAELSEKDLITGLKGKNRMTFSQIYLIYFPIILGYVRERIPNSDDAQDLTQDSLIVLCANADTFRKLENLTDVKKILYGIARNKISMYFREKERSDSFIKEYTGVSALNEDLHGDAKIVRDNEMHFEIYNYISTLEGQAKEIYELMYPGNFSIKEISEKLQTSTGNVRNQHYKIIQKLRGIVAKYKSSVTTSRMAPTIFLKSLYAIIGIA